MIKFLIVALLIKKIVALFLALFGKIVAPPNSKQLITLISKYSTVKSTPNKLTKKSRFCRTFWIKISWKKLLRSLENVSEFQRKFWLGKSILDNIYSDLDNWQLDIWRNLAFRHFHFVGVRLKKRFKFFTCNLVYLQIVHNWTSKYKKKQVFQIGANLYSGAFL